MKVIYPAFIKKAKKQNKYDVYVSDLEIKTSAESVLDAIEKARDAIGLKCTELQDCKLDLPLASDLESMNCNDNEFINLIDVDPVEYRKKTGCKTVRRNVSIPSWINYRAEKSGINVSAVLTKALKAELDLY